MNPMQPIRVLQIVDNLSTISGVSSMIINLYRNIDRTKVQFDFLVSVSTKQSYEAEVVALGGRIYYTGNPLSIKTLLKAQKNIKSFFKSYSSTYHIVHLHSPTISEFTIRYAKKYGVNHIIVHSHSTMTSTDQIKALLNKILTLRVKKYANHYWSCSNEAACFLFGPNYKKLNGFELIYNAVDISLFQFNAIVRKQIRSELNLEDAIVVSHISNFSPIKNHIFLINVIKQLPINYKFLFIGDGPEKARFEHELKSMGCYEKCVFLGRREDVNILLQGSDIVILPSIKEGLPVTIVEAQAAGLPCLISDSITKDVKVNKVVYLPLDAAKWRKNLLCFNILSDEERQEASNNFALSRFNIEKESKRVEKLYLNMRGKNE